MPSYVTTPLFPIQEAVNSSSSLQEVKQSNELVFHDTQSINFNIYQKLLLLIENYKKSELDYLLELKLLKSIIENFNPVYDNYFDESLDDITDEMVKERSVKNQHLLKNVENLISSHENLVYFLNLSNHDDLLLNVSNWGKTIAPLYDEYNSFYKLNIHQSKIEVKTRRRPLIRIRYLSAFFHNLKNVFIQLQETRNSSLIVSNLEVCQFKLEKSLNTAKILDESEKTRWSNYVHISNCVDIVSLKNVCTSLASKDLEDSFICGLQYINKIENRFLNFENIDIVFLKKYRNSSVNQLAVIKRENFGKSLLFSPIKENEFTLVQELANDNIDDDHNVTLVFKHAVQQDAIQLRFEMKAKSGLKLKLLHMFKKNQTETTFGTISTGLGLRMPVEKPKNESVTRNNAALTLERPLLSIPEPSTIPQLPVPKKQPQQLHIYKTQLQEQTVSNQQKPKSQSKATNISCSIQDPLSGIAPASHAALENTVSSTSSLNIDTRSSASVHRSRNTPYKYDESNEIDIQRKFIKQIGADESSDEESILSDKAEEDEEKDDEVEEEKKQDNAVENKCGNMEMKETMKPQQLTHTVLSSSSTSTLSLDSKKTHSLSFEKYKNSLLFDESKTAAVPNKEKKKQRQSIFGTFSNLLSRSSNRQQKSQNSTIKNGGEIPSSTSLESISWSLKDEKHAKEMENIVGDDRCEATAVGNCKVSVWVKNSWTKSKNVELVLHELESHYYLGCYEEDADSEVPAMLLKINNEMDCMFNPIDIHVTCANVFNEKMIISIKPMDKSGMQVIGNALVCPESIKDFLLKNSTSYGSELSNESTDMSNHQDSSSIESVETELSQEQCKVQFAELPTLKDIEKSWSGVGSLYAVENNKIKDLDRCIANVHRINHKVNIEFIGFDFGNIEINLQSYENVKINTNKLRCLIDDRYILKFDSGRDIREFNDCVF